MHHRASHRPLTHRRGFGQSRRRCAASQRVAGPIDVSRKPLQVISGIFPSEFAEHLKELGVSTVRWLKMTHFDGFSAALSIAIAQIESALSGYIPLGVC